MANRARSKCGVADWLSCRSGICSCMSADCFRSTWNFVADVGATHRQPCRACATQKNVDKRRGGKQRGESWGGSSESASKSRGSTLIRRETSQIWQLRPPGRTSSHDTSRREGFCRFEGIVFSRSTAANKTTPTSKSKACHPLCLRGEHYLFISCTWCILMKRHADRQRTHTTQPVMAYAERLRSQQHIPVDSGMGR